MSRACSTPPSRGPRCACWASIAEAMVAAVPPALALNNSRKVYLSRKGTAVEAISGISLAVRQNEVVALVGPSGCGKSTLLRILGGLDTDYDGDIEWALPLQGEGRSRLRSATVFQSDSTFPWM